MMTNRNKQAAWIAEEMGVENVDDVYDALLGNITKPDEFYSEVQSLALEYENIYERNKKLL